MRLFQDPHQGLRRQGQHQQFHLIPPPLDVRGNIVNAGVKCGVAVQVDQYQVVDCRHDGLIKGSRGKWLCLAGPAALLYQISAKMQGGAASAGVPGLSGLPGCRRIRPSGPCPFPSRATVLIIRSSRAWARVNHKEIGRAGVPPAAFGGTGFQPVHRPGKMPGPPRIFQTRTANVGRALPAKGAATDSADPMVRRAHYTKELF